MRSRLAFLALAVAMAGQACVWLLPEPIHDEGGGPSSGGGPNAGGGGNGGGGGGNGGGGNPPVVCSEPCTSGEKECSAPIGEEIYFEPTVADDEITRGPDGVFPSGFAVSGDQLFSALRYKPGISGGPDGPQYSPSQWLVRLPESTHFVRTYECHPATGGMFSSNLAATANNVYTLLSTTRSDATPATMTSSAVANGDACQGANNVIVSASNVDGFTPFLFSYGASNGIDQFHHLTEDLAGRDTVFLAVAANQTGEVAVLGAASSDTFGTTDFPGFPSGYLVIRFHEDAPLTQDWAVFEEHQALGNFTTIDFEGGIALDEGGNVWVTGTRNEGGQPRAFVTLHHAGGGAEPSWLGPVGTHGREIVVQDGRVVVALDFTGQLTVPGGVLNAAGLRDLAVLGFDATSFETPIPAPIWSYPNVDPAHDNTADDSVVGLAFTPPGCDPPGLYALACLGTDCAARIATSGTLMLLDPITGSQVSKRDFEPDAGALSPSHLAVTTVGVWLGFDLQGQLGTHASKQFTPSTNLASSALMFQVPL